MNITQSISGFLTPYAFETITANASVKTLTASKLKPFSTQAQRDMGHARLILVTIENDAIRYTLDGTTPVAGTTGHVASLGSGLSFANYQAMLNFKFTRETTDAVLQITYLR